MKPARFKYFACRSVPEAISVLSEHGDDAKVLAGGQSLVPMMNMRLATPSAVVDITRVPELAEVRVGADTISLGATVRQLDVERSDELARTVPLLRETLAHVGHVPIRSRGTVGGSVAHADPAAELPAVMLVLDAQLIATGPQGPRTLAAADFFKTYFTTALADDELLSEIRIPCQTHGWGWAFIEVARRHGDFALVGVAALVKLDAERRISQARVALSGVADTPVRAVAAEELLRGRAPHDQALREAERAVAEVLNPPDDIHASGGYRKQVAGVITRRALALAASRANRREAGLT